MELILKLIAYTKLGGSQMLVLKIEDEDYIIINGNIKVKFMKYSGGFRVGIEAPKEVSIKRRAVYERDLDAAREAEDLQRTVNPQGK
jgi:sRNA-binding carbon storage regulator CsrA